MSHTDQVEAILIALQTPSPQGQTGIPILLWGGPGQGKSSFLEGLATSKFPVQTIIAAIHDPTDFSGLPVLVDNHIQYAVPQWVNKFNENKDGLLFLDEISTAPPTVQAALMRIVLERKVGYHQLPSGVRIIAAANPPDEIIGGWELTPPLANRFLHFDWKLPAEVYTNGITNGFKHPLLPTIDIELHQKAIKGWKRRVADFINQFPNLLNTSPDENEIAFASPRTWDFAIALMASSEVLGKLYTYEFINAQSTLGLLKASIGSAAALPFFEFIVNLKMPNAEELLAGNTSLDYNNLNESELFVLWSAMGNILRRSWDKGSFSDYSENYLLLTKKLFQANKKDIVYVPLRSLLKDGFLPHLLDKIRSSSEPDYLRVKRIIKEVFNDEELNLLVNLIETI